MVYTLEDYRLDKCTLDDIGKTIPEEIVPEYTQPRSQDLISNYLAVFEQLGGVEELLRFAQKNQGKFYDQLLKILMGMEAPKESAKEERAKASVSTSDLEGMTTLELKQRLLEGLGK